MDINMYMSYIMLLCLLLLIYHSNTIT